MNNTKNIEIDPLSEDFRLRYCTFNLNDKFALYGHDYKNINDKNTYEYGNNNPDRYIKIYSTKSKKNKWNHERTYKISNKFCLISIDDEQKKLYLLSNNYIYEYNLTENMIRSIIYIHEGPKVTHYALT
jgi:hypothetical protein